MQHEWMIRVLEDLQSYARMHRLLALAEHLDQARFLAMTEIANLPGMGNDPASGDPEHGPPQA